MTLREQLHVLQDASGCITPSEANRIIDAHGLAMVDYLEETHDVKFHVNELATWLGY